MSSKFCKSAETMAPLLCVAVAVAALSQINAVYAGSYNWHWALSVSEPSPQQSVPKPPAPPPRVGLNGYRRYFANNSFFGAPIACSYDEKVCFKYNLMFNPASKRCTPVGGNIYFCELRPDRKQFQIGVGRLSGECKKYRDPCPGWRMEYDQRCYQKETVRNVICGGSNLTRHFLGGVECLSEKKQPISVQQPPEDGRCRVPDLRFPDSRSVFFESPLVRVQGFYSDRTNVHYGREAVRLQCAPPQAACFANRSVSVAGHEGCFPLLRRGPCPEEHVVALRGEAALEGRAEGACVHVRGGCARGHKRMAFDGQCHEDRAVAIAAPGKIYWNQFGQVIVISSEYQVRLSPTVHRDGGCAVLVTLYAEGGGVTGVVPLPPCGANDRNLCSLYEVEADAPAPEED